MKLFDIILEKWKKTIGEKWIQRTASFSIETIDIALDQSKNNGVVTLVPEGGQRCLVAATDLPLAFSSINSPPMNYPYNTESEIGSIG
jgi:hypothetical protein